MVKFGFEGIGIIETRNRIIKFGYIKRFDLVCTRFVGTVLNDDTLKQFFIQRFFKFGTIRDVLERNPQTLADAKRAVTELEN